MIDTENEYELFLKLKEWYPKTMKDINFEEYYLYEVKRIESQLEDGYIDISNTCGDELIFKIIVEAFELYKDKHKLA